jgi:hypothetical protein
VCVVGASTSTFTVEVSREITVEIDFKIKMK